MLCSACRVWKERKKKSFFFGARPRRPKLRKTETQKEVPRVVCRPRRPTGGRKSPRNLALLCRERFLAPNDACYRAPKPLLCSHRSDVTCLSPQASSHNPCLSRKSVSDHKILWEETVTHKIPNLRKNVLEQTATPSATWPADMKAELSFGTDSLPRDRNPQVGPKDIIRTERARDVCSKKEPPHKN